MKIAIIIKSFCETTFSFAEAWAEAGHSVDVYYISSNSQVNKEPGFESNFIKVPIGQCYELNDSECHGASQMLRYAHVHLFFFRIPDSCGDLKSNPLRGIANCLESLWYVSHLGRSIRSKSYDSIEIIYPSKELNILLYFLSPKNTIVSFHEIVKNKNKINIGWNDIHNALKIAIYKGFNIRLYSKSMMNELLSRFPQYKPFLHFLPFGPFTMYRDYENIEIPKLGYLPKEYLLFFGYIYDYKGLDILWKSTEKLEKEGNPINVVIAGNGYVPVLNNMKASSYYTVINRFIENAEVIQLIKKCKAVVCPYIGGSQSGLPMTVYPFVKPIIATTIGDFSEVILDNKTGFIVQPNNPNELAESIHKVFSNEKLYSELIGNITKFDDMCIEHSWKIIVKKYESMVTNLCAKKPTLNCLSYEYLKTITMALIFG